ncbi:MAG: efflux RND transporter permease subunit [Gammaproteobacteria bacterium]|nr:efflux RND transporter permease subunit [Gammaproteobacteria bacterium]MDP2139916.1 efflux RND transporter permease subunit [Gammaproteobacteria bacterium]MDP2347736.1 efflux RND transporter permease subunit [Gammaproteobacteria bacterium]
MKTVIYWFIDNPIASNLLMMVFIVAGTISFLNLRQEEFPSIETGTIQINIAYPGAAPEEAEKAVCLPLEEALETVENVERMTSTAREGACAATVVLAPGADLNRMLNDVKSAVDGIIGLPADIESPIVASFSPTSTVMSLAVAADTDAASLKEIAEEIRLDLVDLDGISRVEVNYIRPYEIAVEISEFTLRQYNLTLNQVATAINNSAMDMPAGTLRTTGGDILLRSMGRISSGAEYENIIVRSYPDGSQLRLGDIATVIDGFEEGYLTARVDGKSAAIIEIYRVGDEDTVASAKLIKEYVEQKRPRLPASIELSILTDDARALQERISTVASNAYSGFALVLLVLTLFLRFKLAVWVAAGIPIAMLGALTIFPSLGLTISSLTIMGFILVIGIVVDDAIVVAERIFVYEQKGMSSRDAAGAGTMSVAVPVVFGVFTSIAAFLPLLLLDGQMGSFFNVIGAVVALCLIGSLIESQLILPGHLAHRRTTGYWLEGTPIVEKWLQLQKKIASGLEYFAHHYYQPALRSCLHHRYAAWATATAVILITVGLLMSGRVVFQFFPAVEGDRIYATVQMPEGVAVAVTEQALQRIETAAAELTQELEAELADRIARGIAPATASSVVDKTLTTLGARINRGGPGGGSRGAGGSHIAEVVLILNSYEARGQISANEVRDRWREKVGFIPDALELGFVSDSFSAGQALSFRLEGRSEENLRLATAELREALARYPGVFDVSDSFRAGKQEVQIEILREGELLGFTLDDISRQVRQAFYGAESQRIQRGSDQIKVMVRYPESERRSLGNLEDMLLRTPGGGEVPLSSVAKLSLGNGYSSINRQDGRRVITVNADINRSVSTPEQVTREISTEFRERWETDYQISMRLSGEGEQRNASLAGLLSSYPLALLIIFALLAIPLKSYAQPLIIMSVIPFGAIGAIIGHFIMNTELVFFSLIGIVALGGVVVNSSLVLVDYINREVTAGHSLHDAVAQAGAARFRPIFLTSVTTFIGLVPLMANPTPATFFIVPMAISLGFGVLFATLITLFLVPSLYLILYDFTTHSAEETARTDAGASLLANDAF